MSRRKLAAIAATLLLAGNLVGAEAQERERAAVVIVACDHGGRAELATRVSGVEAAGRVPERLAAALEAEASCAGAFNVLGRAGFELAHRLPAVQGDFDTNDDIDGRDFWIWRRTEGASAAQPPARAATVLLKCDYVVADGLVTRVAGSETAGPVSTRLAAALSAGPSCAAAWAMLTDAGLGLVSVEPAPVAGGIHASDLADWQSDYGAGG